jgi:membrane-associated phospholipid phosphatase
MGLGLSLALAFMFTQGMKNLFGKPRPNLLDHCQPDLSAASIARHTVGGYSAGFNREWILVNADICTQSDSGKLNDGFRSFPSGHSSSESPYPQLCDQITDQ